MKTFHCTACQALVFFENTRCLTCNVDLAFVPDKMSMRSLVRQSDGSWRTVDESAGDGGAYRLCANYVEHGICNWAIAADAPGAFCLACSLTQIIPDLSVSGNREAWAKLETAKRRMIFGLLSLNLEVIRKQDAPTQGVAFQFLSDVTWQGDRSRVLTGHDNGIITVNVAEADDVHRESERALHAEPYRTLLGHFRHEIGHYYWDRLILGTERTGPFRELFGDERADYTAALSRHYEQGAPSDWCEKYISAYASTHPWEDWAESWAHVMHMVDALETAQAVGLSLQPQRGDEPALVGSTARSRSRIADVDQLISDWYALTYVLNNLTRGLGLADAYPFVLSTPVVEKLRFICATIVAAEGVTTVESPTSVAA